MAGAARHAKDGTRLQSAIEYLTTYGWALLVIAAVVAALYYLGVFNSTDFAPRAQPGACQISRPNGPGTVDPILLDGLCNNELPEYVASFPSSGGYARVPFLQFEPAITYEGHNSLTVTLWASTPKSAWQTLAQYEPLDQLYQTPLGPQPYPNIALWYSGVCTNGQDNYYATVLFWGQNASWQFDNPIGQCGNYAVPLTQNQMYFYVMEYDGNTLSAYVGAKGKIFDMGNGHAPISWNPSLGYLPPDQTLLLGCCDEGLWYGYMSNVQVYNTTLTVNELDGLYLEGIGGAPISLNHLVGWWPLNGNSNDYSGNGKNLTTYDGSGYPNTNILSYTNSWTATYSPP